MRHYPAAHGEHTGSEPVVYVPEGLTQVYGAQTLKNAITRVMGTNREFSRASLQVIQALSTPITRFYGVPTPHRTHGYFVHTWGLHRIQWRGLRPDQPGPNGGTPWDPDPVVIDLRTLVAPFPYALLSY